MWHDHLQKQTVMLVGIYASIIHSRHAFAPCTCIRPLHPAFGKVSAAALAVAFAAAFAVASLRRFGESTPLFDPLRSHKAQNASLVRENTFSLSCGSHFKVHIPPRTRCGRNCGSLPPNWSVTPPSLAARKLRAFALRHSPPASVRRTGPKCTIRGYGRGHKSNVHCFPHFVFAMLASACVCWLQDVVCVCTAVLSPLSPTPAQEASWASLQNFRQGSGRSRIACLHFHT